jgi:hypothetical protein
MQHAVRSTLYAMSSKLVPKEIPEMETVEKVKASPKEPRRLRMSYDAET